MTEINSVNAVQTQTSALSTETDEDELSSATKSELEALGIPITDGMTEAEAQEKIQEAKLEKQAEMGAQPAATETELMADVKTLAGEMGVAYSDTDDTETIITNIAAELEAQIDEAENNPQELSVLVGYFNQLKNLDETFDEIQTVQEKIFAAMNFAATKNKQEHGLE